VRSGSKIVLQFMSLRWKGWSACLFKMWVKKVSSVGLTYLRRLRSSWRSFGDV